MVVAMPVNIKEGQAKCLALAVPDSSDEWAIGRHGRVFENFHLKRSAGDFSIGALKDMAMLSTEVVAVYQYCVSRNQVKDQRDPTRAGEGTYEAGSRRELE